MIFIELFIKTLIFENKLHLKTSKYVAMNFNNSY